MNIKNDEHISSRHHNEIKKHHRSNSRDKQQHITQSQASKSDNKKHKKHSPSQSNLRSRSRSRQRSRPRSRSHERTRVPGRVITKNNKGNLAFVPKWRNAQH